MDTKRTIFVRHRFEGFHRWEDAPEPVAFLGHLHRHIFHVEVQIAVEHGNRDREFVIELRKVKELCETAQKNLNPHRWSCEMWAEYLLEAITGAERVIVSEDGENGAIVERK